MSDAATTGNEEQARYWSNVAPAWLEAEAVFEMIGGPVGELALDRLQLQPSQQVLDVGCGTGSTTIEIARRVAPGGQVVGIDIADELLAPARLRLQDHHDLAVDFVQADAQTEFLGDERFDAAYSRFGVMFFSDPIDAFFNLHRSLKSDGMLSFVSWQPVFVNEWALLPVLAAVSVLGTMPQPPGPDEPGPFSLSDPDKVATLLNAAGFAQVDVVPYDEPVVTPAAQIPVLARTAVRMGGVRDMVTDADDDTVDEVVAAIESALRERVVGDELRIARGVLLVTARA